MDKTQSEDLVTIQLSEFHPSAYKWTVEEIIETIWPFSKFKLPYNFLVLFLVYLGVGIYFVIMRTPASNVIINGVLVTASIVVGSVILVWYAQRMRKVEIAFTPDKSKNMSFARHFRDLLGLQFSDVSIFPGVVIYTFLIAFLFTGNHDTFIEEVLGGMNDFGLLLFDFILLWDICYRLGVGLWSPSIMLLGAIRLNKVAKSSSSPPLYAYSVKEIQKMAILNLMFVLPAFFLIPLVQIFPFLFLGLVCYISAILGLTIISSLMLRSRVV